MTEKSMNDQAKDQADAVHDDAGSNAQRARVFISYKRDVEPDERVALRICEVLSRQHDVFIDQTMLVGTRWAGRIEAELRRSDYLITFLSAESVHSEMMLMEIETAHHLCRDRLAKGEKGRPAILPVRMAYSELLRYPLSAYLNPINWAVWESDEDMPRLIEELRQAVSGGVLSIDEQPKPRFVREGEPEEIPVPSSAAQPLRLESPEGTMRHESKFYVERPDVDSVALKAVEQPGMTMTIKGPRQMGKSSLLMRAMAAAAQAGKHVVFLDFQLFDKRALNDADTFFRQFCAWLTDKLDLEDRVEEAWQRPLGNPQRCTRYVGRYLLKELGAPLFLAMDEVESVFETDFRSDFFSMLRSWHNDRAYDKRWRQLDLALVTSTEPYQLIENLNQSPFNVGEVIELTDFLPQQVADLNRRHGSPLSSAQEEQLMALLGGHPYLTRKALYLVASRRLTMADLLATATRDRGPFGDHLRYHLFRLQGHEALIRSFRQVLRQHTCPDEGIFWRLRGAGLVRREGRDVVPRCTLYADYFREHLDG